MGIVGDPGHGGHAQRCSQNVDCKRLEPRRRIGNAHPADQAADHHVLALFIVVGRRLHWVNTRFMVALQPVHKLLAPGAQGRLGAHWSPGAEIPRLRRSSFVRSRHRFAGLGRRKETHESHQIGCFGGRQGKHQPVPLEIFIAAPDRNPTQTQSAGTCHFLEPAVHAGKLFFRGPEDHSPGSLVGIKDTHRRRELVG